MTTPTRLAEIAERQAFEAFHRAEGWTDNMLIRMENGEYQRNLQNRFIGWQARASRPVVVTDERVEAAAKVANSFQFPSVGWSDLREPYKQRLIGRVRQVLSAALNMAANGAPKEKAGS